MLELKPHFDALEGLRWTRHTLANGQTLVDRRTFRYSRLVGSHDILCQAIVRRVWVRLCSHITSSTLRKALHSWAIFHVVGANPKMKSELPFLHSYVHANDMGFSAMYRWYQILICLLKFDFFFFTGVTMQVRGSSNTSRFMWFTRDIASYPRVTNKLCRVWYHHCRHSRRLDPAHILRIGCTARNQGVSEPTLMFF